MTKAAGTKGKTGGKRGPKPVAPPFAITPCARENLTDAEIEAAASEEDRGLLAFRLLSSGQWDRATTTRLRNLWKVTETTLHNYRRHGKVALAAVGAENREQRVERVLASLQLQADEHEHLAKFYEARNRPTLAVKHRSEMRRATMDFAEVAGLLQQRISVSVEADPRVAGMYQAILGALEDRDRQEAERRAAFEAWCGEVEKLTGGVLPPGLPEALPSAREHVRDAVKRYETEIGARTEARKLAA